MRHAVEEHLNEAPEVKPDTRLAIYDDGCQIFCAGTAMIYVDLQTGLFWKDTDRRIPASDDEARHAGVPVREWHHKRRARKLRQDTEDHIAALTAKQAEPQVSELERKKAIVRAAIKEQARKVQRETDLAVTRDILPDTPAA